MRVRNLAGVQAERLETKLPIRQYVDASPARVLSSTVIALATSPAMSDRLLGMMRVLLVRARFWNASMYFSATFRLAALMPPGEPMAEATARTALALAFATSSMAPASPAALLICACFWPSDSRIAAWRWPSAMLISCWRLPSEVAITARFSRSAVICACMARRIDSGGVRLFSS